MTPAERFAAAHLRGIQGSFSRGEITVKRKDGSVLIPNCLVATGTNKAQAEEYGLALARTLDLQIQKDCLQRRPSPANELIIHQGREYTIAAVEGDDDASPVWALSCTAPI